MDRKIIKNFFGSCHDAKKIVELIPALPKGIKPRHIHVIEEIYEISEKKSYVKVSDVSDSLKVTRPSVTKLINELEEKKVIKKSPFAEDNRITTLTLTELGKEYYDIYVKKFYTDLIKRFDDITEDEIRISTETIGKIYKILKTEVY